MSEHTQVGPYALGLLDPLEMSRFEEHLAECDECADPAGVDAAGRR